MQNYEDEKEGVIRIQDVRAAMKAQGLSPRDAKELKEFVEILDAEGDGFVTYGNFVAVCALKINEKKGSGGADHEEEVDRAFKLFTKGGEGPITIAHLRRVAEELRMREEVSDDMLRNMILEANGGAGLNRGVRMEDFHNVMTRAGML